MKVPQNRLVPILFALSGVFSLVPAVKQLIKGESLNEAFLVLALANFVFAAIFFANGAVSTGGPLANPARRKLFKEHPVERSKADAKAVAVGWQPCRARLAATRKRNAMATALTQIHSDVTGRV